MRARSLLATAWGSMAFMTRAFRSLFLKENISWLVAMSGWAARIVAVLARFLVILILLDYLGVDQYAVCAVILSLEAWFALCDCGLGFSAQNFVVEARARGESVVSWLRSVAQLSLGLLVVFVLCISVGAPLLSSFLFKKTACSHHYTFSVFCAGLLYGVGAIGSIGYRILYAQQRGYWVHVLNTLGTVLSFVSLWGVSHWTGGGERLLLSLLCLTGIPAVISCSLFFKMFPLCSLCSSVNRQEIKALAARSLRFWGFTVSNVFLLGMDYIILARMLPASDIVLYSVVNKMFMGFFVMHGTWMQAVWPLCSEHVALGRFEEITRLMGRYCLYGMLFIGGVTAFIGLTAPLLCRLFFSAQSLNIPLSLVLLFGCYYTIRVLCDPYSMVLQSASRLRVLLILVPVQAALNCMGQIFFAALWGVQGIVCGLIFSFASTALWVIPWAFYRWVGQQKRSFRAEA